MCRQSTDVLHHSVRFLTEIKVKNIQSVLIFLQLVLPVDFFPVNRPGAVEYLHILYAVSTPLVLLKVNHQKSTFTCRRSGQSPTFCSFFQMLERSPRTLPRPAVRLGIICVVMGTSLHLVADSVTRRLVLIGYQLHLSVRENPVMQELKPASLVGDGSVPSFSANEGSVTTTRQIIITCFIVQVDAFELLFYYDDTLGHVMWYGGQTLHANS